MEFSARPSDEQRAGDAAPGKASPQDYLRAWQQHYQEFRQYTQWLNHIHCLHELARRGFTNILPHLSLQGVDGAQKGARQPEDLTMITHTTAPLTQPTPQDIGHLEALTGGTAIQDQYGIGVRYFNPDGSNACYYIRGVRIQNGVRINEVECRNANGIGRNGTSFLCFDGPGLGLQRGGVLVWDEYSQDGSLLGRRGTLPNSGIQLTMAELDQFYRNPGLAADHMLRFDPRLSSPAMRARFMADIRQMDRANANQDGPVDWKTRLRTREGDVLPWLGLEEV